MRTKKLFNGFCCSTPVTILALLAVFMPFCLAADVLDARVFDFSVYYKVAIGVVFAVFFLILYRQTNLVKS